MNIGLSYADPEPIDKTNDNIHYPKFKCPHCRKWYQLDYYPTSDKKRWNEDKCKFCNQGH